MGSELQIANPVTRITAGTRERIQIKNKISILGGSHVESKNSAERARGSWNHIRHMWPGLSGCHNSSLSRVLAARQRSDRTARNRKLTTPPSEGHEGRAKYPLSGAMYSRAVSANHRSWPRSATTNKILYSSRPDLGYLSAYSITSAAGTRFS